MNTPTDPHHTTNRGPVVQHPLRLLVQLLPGLPLDGKNIDYPAANPFQLRELSEHLDVLVGLAQNGIASVGHLLALAAPEIEGGELSSDTIEALGWLLSELGDLAAWATTMNLHCKEVNSDFAPPQGPV